MRKFNTIICSVFLLIALLLPVTLIYAQDTQEQEQEQESGKLKIGEGFDIKNFIFDHLTDDYGFHILTIKQKHITIPLPIILKSERGWFFFMSSKLSHGESYKGFSIATEGNNRRKAVEYSATGEEVKPWDFSLTKNVFSILLGSFVLCLILLSVRKKYKRNKMKAPSGIQALVEPLILFVTEDVSKPALGEKSHKYDPYLLTVFFFILTVSLMGLIPAFPFGANALGNVNVTAVLALFTLGITMASTNKKYWMHKINTPGIPMVLKFPIPLMPFVELLGVITGPLALLVRLFANMLAGHMVVIVLLSLIFMFSTVGSIALDGGVTFITVLFSAFIMLLDVLICFIQAYVFTLLSALYFSGAKEH